MENLEEKYVSVSSQDGIKTGNRYQSIKLGDEHTPGFRSDRGPFLDQIDFRGKKVLDLGSNLGELSRDARARGAWLVDGFEFDERFIETAMLINTYNDVTRVSFFQRDITDRATYDDHYDIVLAFSVFTYLKHVMDKIATITDDLLILETHKLDGNLRSTYLDPISKLFPHHHVLGESDWGTRLDQSVKRAVIAFAKSEQTLADGLIGVDQPALLAAASSAAVPTSDPVLGADTWHVDVRRTSFYDTFFETVEFTTVDALLDRISTQSLDLEALWETADLKRLVSGWAYWWVYLKGCVEYGNGNKIDDNVYLRFMSDYYLPRQYDPALSNQLDSPAKIRQRIELRFKDFRLFHSQPGRPSEVTERLLPLTIAVKQDQLNNRREVLLQGPGAPPCASLINGFHRLFLARLFGADNFRCRLLGEAATSSHRPASPIKRDIDMTNSQSGAQARVTAASSGDRVPPRIGGVVLPEPNQSQTATGFYGQFWDNYVEKTWPMRAAARAGELEWPGDEWGEPEGWDRLYQDLIVPAGVERWERAVEIGPGSGKYTTMVLTSSQASIRAYDVSAKFLEICAERCAEWVAEERLSLQVLDLRPSQMLVDLQVSGWRRRIDAFYSIDAMVHVDLQYLIVYLLTAALTLRPGGKLVLTLADVTGDKGFAKLMSNISWAYPAQSRPMGSAKFEWLSPEIVHSLLPRLGFEIEVLLGAPRKDLLVTASLIDPVKADSLEHYLTP